MKPFIRWVGGKQKHIKQIKRLMPDTYVDYYEPFVGGGSIVFALQPKTFVINDINEELILAYKVLSDPILFEEVKQTLREFNEIKSEETYLFIRDWDIKELKDSAIVARFIFLNRTCFNGLYRLNKLGKFNVSYDLNKLRSSYNVLDERLLNSIHEYLRTNKGVILNTSDFKSVIMEAKPGDFVLLDPPYDAYDEQDNFNEYGNSAFSKDDQRKLAECFRELDRKGVNVMLFNYKTPLIDELYGEFYMFSPDRKLTLTKEHAKEIIVTNYLPPRMCQNELEP